MAASEQQLKDAAIILRRIRHLSAQLGDLKRSFEAEVDAYQTEIARLKAAGRVIVEDCGPLTTVHGSIGFRKAYTTDTELTPLELVEWTQGVSPDAVKATTSVTALINHGFEWRVTDDPDVSILVGPAGDVVPGVRRVRDTTVTFTPAKGAGLHLVEDVDGDDSMGQVA